MSSLNEKHPTPSKGLRLTYPKIPLQPLQINKLSGCDRSRMPYTTSVSLMASTLMSSTLVLQLTRPGPCSMPNTPGGCHHWQDLTNRQRPPSQRTGAPRVRTGLPECTQPGRNIGLPTHTCTQHLFKTSKKRCACDFLSSTWDVEPFPVPMALQEPYWRGVFQTAMCHDDRRPPPKGPVEWSLVALLTVEDVTRVIKGMSDGALGPNGRTLNGLKAL